MSRVYVIGAGICTPLGRGIAEHALALKKGSTGIAPLSLFPVNGTPLPVGGIPFSTDTGEFPRTHILALMAAAQIVDETAARPDALIVGTTTGGMPLSEELIKKGRTDTSAYAFHGTDTVAHVMARRFGITGPALTITNACSSGTVALALAARLIRTGMARTVLAGGADALCRLTYYGFNSLQLIDPDGSKPFDSARRGMSVGEGAAFLLLSGREEDSPFAMAEVMGSGMSCDAYHPASPHPDGEGALKAMTAALKNAGITPAGIDYVNLHGTGTVENDRAEGRALFALFGSDLPFLSSTKGATGHALAASGAVEAVLSCIALSEGIVPGTVGCTSPDAEIPVTPLLSALQHPVRCVLSNSFGFGGNNAAIVLSQPRILPPPPDTPRAIRFEVIGHSCLTGVGSCQASKEALEKGQPITGAVPNDELVRSFPPREVRRLKRLPRMVLTLAHEAIDSCGGDNPPGAIIFGTSRGPLSETHDFLSKLFESGEQFPSPTDFVGSVHNSPAGLAAIHLKAHGPNITVTGGDRSFEDSLLAASLVACDCDGPLLLLCADEHHDHLTPVLDDKTVREDGGGGLLLKIPGEIPVSPLITFRQYMTESGGKSSLDVLVERELSSGDPSRHIGALFASDRAALMITQSGVSVPTLRISQITGTHAASAAAAVSLAVSWLAARKIPREGARSIELDGRAIAFVLDGAHSSFILLELP